MINKTIIVCSILFFLTSFSGSNKSLDRQGKDYAIFFAINGYQGEGWDSLPTPIRDAETIAEILNRRYNFETEVIRNPTKYDIQKKLKTLSQKKYGVRDQLFIYFTGHGSYEKPTSENQNGLGYFVPSDAKSDDEFKNSYLPYVLLQPAIDKISCRHVLLVIDACHSGSFFNYKNGRPGELSAGEKLIRDVMPFTSRIGITSGNLEPVKSGIGHSPFARKFMEGLSSGGGDDKVLTSSELYTAVEDGSPRPQRGFFGQHHSEGDFLFISKDFFQPDLSENNSVRQQELSLWKKAKEERTIEAYKKYISTFPNGDFVARAQQSINSIIEDDKIAWGFAIEMNTTQSYDNYLKMYPEGKYIAEAKKKYAKRKAGIIDLETLYSEPMKEESAGRFDLLGAQKKVLDKMEKRGSFVDERDNQSYPWVILKDDKKWMAENLNYNSTNSR